jgi:predicted dehydrogenase
MTKPSHPVSVAAVGISGMGFFYVQALRDEFPPGTVEIQAVVDPHPERSGYFSLLKEKEIPIFESIKEYYRESPPAELVIVSSPPQYHVHQCVEAFHHGSHVLCEKPIGATIQDADLLIRSEDAADVWCMIGYQWSFTRAIHDLKKDILDGSFGRPVQLKTMHLWPRDEKYYQRNAWAGKVKDEEGIWVLDSPANGAMAHELHNLFYILGKHQDSSASPREVTAELYRAYPIENFDTVACRMYTDEGCELLYYASHAADKKVGPVFDLDFEHASVSFDEASDQIIARFHKGGEKRYGSPEKEHHLKKLFRAVESVRESKTVLCGPNASRAQTLCISGIQESASGIVSFEPHRINKEEGRRWVDRLREDLCDCYEQGILPYEKKLGWAHSGKTIDLNEFLFFPGGTQPNKLGR